MSAVLNTEATQIVTRTLHSEVFKTSRVFRVCLPASYEDTQDQRYPVLYIHDGQNAFSTAGPGAAFGWGNWELDKTAARLAREERMREVILVGIDCGASRYREYRGPAAKGTDNRAYTRYSDFLLTELKPLIDAEYRSLPDPSSTGVLGSSMGGICSLALAWEHPGTFGNAASLSGAFQVENKFFLRKVVAERKRKKPVRIYLDSGIADYSGGDDGASDTAALASELERIGWVPGKDLMHFTDRPLTAEELQPFDLPPDKFEEAQRSQHNELYWRLRAWKALQFLFPCM